MAEITLLDGGMGQELVARSGDEPTSLWATRVMIDHPGMVRAIHEDYFEAGATVATTNTYAGHHDRLARFYLIICSKRCTCGRRSKRMRRGARGWRGLRGRSGR